MKKLGNSWMFRQLHPASIADCLLKETDILFKSGRKHTYRELQTLKGASP